VGATIVEREYLPFVTAKQHRTVGPVHYHHLVFFQFSERCGVKVLCKTRRDAKGGHSQEDNRFIVPTRGDSKRFAQPRDLRLGPASMGKPTNKQIT
jgi:D-lyxose ketol-isomerase